MNTPTADGRPDPAETGDSAAALQYPCGEAPAPGSAREIAPGLIWIRMPLPWALNHINLYAIADGDGWAIVDTGAQTTPGIAAWTALLADDGALAGKPVKRVFVTHMHPDHAGMAGWLTRKFDCRLWMTRLEYLTCRSLVADTGRPAPDDAIRFYRAAGWGADALDAYRARFGGFGKVVHPLPDSFMRLFDGQTLSIGDHAWRVVVGNGHSPEHACLVCDALGVLISGDQVLPRISSNVSVFPTEPEADPLSDWIASINKLRAALGDSLLVLPSHGEPFRGLHARLDRLASGHGKGLDRLRRSLANEPRRAIDCFGALFARSITGTGDLLGMATGESIAHLNHLIALGEAIREVDPDGVYRYRMK
jgi:glyoxylase-like metal-dependent hydrolase (beta-lactamase superfamily II)